MKIPTIKELQNLSEIGEEAERLNQIQIEEDRKKRELSRMKDLENRFELTKKSVLETCLHLILKEAKVGKYELSLIEDVNSNTTNGWFEWDIFFFDTTAKIKIMATIVDTFKEYNATVFRKYIPMNFGTNGSGFPKERDVFEIKFDWKKPSMSAVEIEKC